MDDRIWHESYPPGVPKGLEYPEGSLFGILEGAADRFPERPALAFFGHLLSYGELLAEVERCAAGLHSIGVGRGDRVGLILPNCPQYVITYFAALRLGAVAVGHNPLYTEREMRHQLIDADCTVIVVLDQLYPALGDIRADLPGLETVVVTKITDYMGFPLRFLAPLQFRREARAEGRPWPPVAKTDDVLWWDSVISDAHPVPPVAEVDPTSDIAALVYTGGTTGVAKGAMLTHVNLLANSHQAAAWFPEVREGAEAVMCVLPFFLSYGMTVAMNVGILIGAKLILIPLRHRSGPWRHREGAAHPVPRDPSPVHRHQRGSGTAQRRSLLDPCLSLRPPSCRERWPSASSRSPADMSWRDSD